MNRRTFLTQSAGLGIAVASLDAIALDNAESRPARILVPFAAGGPSDQVARTVAQAMAAKSGHPIIVENRPGADGLIAARAALDAPQDGRTLFYMPSSLVGVGQLARPALDVERQFTAVCGIGQLTFAMFTTAQLSVGSVAEFVELARSHPGELNFASSTGSELMAAHQFMRATGARMQRVSYKGAAQALPDLMEGRVQVMFGPLAAALPHARAGKLKLLGMMSPTRSPLAPDSPTLAEAGYASVHVPTWQALFAPGSPGTQFVERYARECSAALGMADVRADLEARALIVEPVGPQAMQAVAGRDRESWRQLIREYQLEAF
jgi:tripartite-type tricarboxylate transporter receptor subunit TctC